MTATTAVHHPAKFTPAVLDTIEQIVDAEAVELGQGLRILDPFAGVGGIHRLGELHETVGVELEPEWAAAHEQTIVGDATDLDAADGSFDAVVTSPCYGNRMADLYDGRDGSRRVTYRLSLGRDLTDGSGAGLQWGTGYRDMHRAAIVEMVRVVRPGGLLIVNMSNHIRDGQVQAVVEWWLEALIARGCLVQEVRRIGTPRMRQGANHELRVDGEHLLVMRTPTQPTSQGALL